MVGLSKSFNNNNKQVLKDIYLSFFYGAKIGIIGLNGSGKSTLLKIIAGIEKSYQGDIHFKGDHSIGYLEQEPKLDSSKTVMDIVKEGAKEQVELLEEYNKINGITPKQILKSNKNDLLVGREKEEREIGDLVFSKDVSVIDPVVQNMGRSEIEKSIENIKKLMEKEAKKENFMQAAVLRD